MSSDLAIINNSIQTPITEALTCLKNDMKKCEEEIVQTKTKLRDYKMKYETLLLEYERISKISVDWSSFHNIFKF